MNIAGILHEQAQRAGDRVAIVERRRTITFAALHRGAAAAAGELSAAGLRPGMRALVLSPMSIALYTVLVALFRLRVTAVFVDPSAGRERLNTCVRRARPEAFVGVPRAHLLRLTSAAIRSIPIKAAMGGGVPATRAVLRVGTSGEAPIEPCAADTPAIITFTSGSTGEPKAAVRTHGFLVAQHRALVQSLALAPGEVDLCTLPIFLLANLASGVTSVIPDADLRSPGTIDAAAVSAQIVRTRPTRTVASPAFLGRLITRTQAGGGASLGTFRRIYTGGAPVFPSMLDAIASAAPGALVTAVYGSTEAEPIAEVDRGDITAPDRAAMGRGGGLLAGRPVASVQLRILPDRWGTPVGPLPLADLEGATLPPEVPGEIIVTGEHVLTGYLDGAGDEETKIKVGAAVWHRTGDAGYVDSQGRLWLLGRCSAKAIDETGVTYPFAVECAASDVAGVVRTAFLMRRGRRMLVLEAAEDVPRVRAELMARLRWARLADVVGVRHIPVDRRHNAKVDYPALLRMLDRTKAG
jgi:acyl-CoA synthetase (AMP-forming)/AMP-acid ligase II